MLDETVILEEYFKDEIKRVSNIEIEQIEDEISEIRSMSIQSMEQDALHIARIQLEQEMRELTSEHAIQLSKTHEETNRKLMKKRRELSDSIFQEAVQQIKDFTQGKEYGDYLVDKARALADGTYGHVVFYVGKRDEAFLSAICKAYGDCDGAMDPDIRIGGLRMECEDKGLVVDETFDTGIDEQRDWFYTNSGLFIK